MLHSLNTFLNRFSMYKVVSLSLSLLFVVALLFSLLGLISHAPLAMIASLSVFGLSCYLTSVLFGLIFGVRIHSESSLITGLILFFIFTPTLGFTGLLSFGIIGVIAAASKFVLTYRGRHIFNPAAAAAFVISLAGLAYASWWVATPPLFLPIFIIGGLIIYKTRRQLMGGVFLATAAPLVLIMLMSYGSSLSESLTLLLSWPLFFFSGVMLSEPLTQPPRKWQQAFEAVIVAILFAVPLHFGDFTTSPALALLVGNLIAFGFSRRRAISLTYQANMSLTPSANEFVFKSSRPVQFEPGQYMEITIPHKRADMRGIRRVFSITSAPNDSDIRFGVKFYKPSSTFKQAMQSLPEGATLQSTGVSGGFTLPKDPTVPLLFIAGGIGITPFISQLRYLKNVKQARDVVLFYAVTNTNELAYADELQAAGIKVFVVTKLSQGNTAKDWVTIKEPHIRKETLQKHIPDIGNRHVYISGPPVMIDGTKQHLKQLKVKRANIKTDYFIGY